MSVRLLLADDHAAVRAGLRLLLEGERITVVGEAADGAAAIRNARALRPDVVLMDVRMPGVDGVEATRAIVAEGTAQVLVLTTFDLDEVVFGALRAGAAGFLLKSAGAEALTDGILRVASGESVLAPEVTRRVLAAFAETRAPAPAPGLEQLTPREREVLAALGRGLGNAELAAELGVGEATAKTHVSSVLAKLGVRSRVQAAIVAREAGLE
ncbi:response regulator [Arenivirga flava]|uniref:DNA-binding response regulator n=1 Tax=Arenivirga flava TaxID=1930060 RepID=A0AA37UQW3_9MICO|nr:response regulator transcription factor [Arenivirga flava]GMA29061.1 DNA-binding response regulator [Arenivirga flava]